MRKLSTLASSITLLGLAISSAHAASVSITNPGFESGFNGWSENGPPQISSSDTNSGSQAAKLQSGGRIEQTVSVSANTDHTLTAYVLDGGTVGADVGSVTYSQSSTADNWTEVSVSFNSGSATSVTLFAEYLEEVGRIDDFSLESGSTNNQGGGGSCDTTTDLTIVNATDDGSNDGHGPLNTIDGDSSISNTESRWSSNNSGKYITWDLGSEQTVESIDIAFFKGNQRSSYFDIDTSSNGSSWTRVLTDGASSGSDAGLESFDLTDSNARYVRFTGYGNSSNTWNSILEANVLGCGDSVSNPNAYNVSRTAVPGQIEAELFSLGEDNSDGNERTVFRPDGDVDIQTTTDIGGGYNIGWMKAGEWLEYPISVSSSGSFSLDARVASSKNTGAFTVSIDGNQVGDTLSVGNTGGWQSWDTKNIYLGNISSGNHTLRITVTGNDFNLNWFELKSEGDTNPGGNGELDPNLPPSGNFDLSVWKITLPTSRDDYFGQGETDKAAEILPDGCTEYGYTGPSLEDGFEDSSYFYTDSDGAMVFDTPLSGGASTVNSSYVRSELRELYNWGGQADNCDGDGDANWGPTGKHVLRGTLQVTDYYSSDPQTVIGQIHAKDSSKALLKLQWDGPTKDIRAIVNEDPTAGNPFSIDFGLIPGTDEFSYVITLEDGTMTIDVTYDGTTVSESVTFGSGVMSSDWNNHVYYFKAGNYAQADKSSGGYFSVKFTELEVQHD